jgi:hypothetical protein
VNKKLLILSLLAAAVLAGITKNGNLGVGIGVLAVVVLFIVSQLRAVSRMKRIKDISELGDDDGGIDWREENVSGEEVSMWKGWAVLMDDVAVHEAKAAAEELERAHIRCRLELLKEDRAWHRFGNGGLGTRMCVLVAPSDYDAARKLVE